MSLRDSRYFAFDTFAVVAWFFIAVQTQPQWWVFLLPPALLVLDSFRSRYGLVFCILILIAYLFYPMHLQGWIGVFANYHIPSLMITGLWFGWVFTVLAGLLLFWVFALSKELSDEEAKSSTAT
jgi:hypothetical protein